METTAQEIFDTVAKRMIAQGRPSMNGDTCMYRSEDGAVCAVGAAIRDDEYGDFMELRSVEDIEMEGDLPERLVPHIRLLKDLQEMHDSLCAAEWQERIRDELEGVAVMHNLSTAVLEVQS